METERYNDENWRGGAACLTTDPELFFPEGDKTMAEQAQAICETCKVAVECLRYALATRQRHGIWGGTTPTGRRKLRERSYKSGEALAS